MNIDTDMIEAAEVPELVSKMVPGIPYEDGEWTYYLTRTRKWIYRALTIVAQVCVSPGGDFVHRKIALGNSSGRRQMMVAFNRRLAAKRKQTKLVCFE
jgi:hypothetical protein